MNQELLQLQPFMLPYDPRQKSKRTPAEIASGRQAYCRLRLEDTIAAGAQQLAGLLQLKNEGVTILDKIESFDYGKFVHILDGEGNQIELWEPKDEEYDKIIIGRTK